MAMLKDFRYHSPSTIKEALNILDNALKPVILGGGTFVLNHLKKSENYPTDVISLKKMPDLCGIKDLGETISVGAMVTAAQLVESVIIRDKFYSLFKACKKLATAPVRNMATIGGNVASRFFWVDLPAVLISLGAEISYETSVHKKKVSVEGFLNNKPKDKFILTGISLPKKKMVSDYFRHTKDSEVGILSCALAFSFFEEKTGSENIKLVVNTATSFPIELKNAEVVLENRDLKDLENSRLDDYQLRCLSVDLDNIAKLLKER